MFLIAELSILSTYLQINWDTESTAVDYIESSLEMNAWCQKLMHTVTATMMTVSLLDRNVVLLKDK
jgi:hypothetical protein